MRTHLQWTMREAALVVPLQVSVGSMICLDELPGMPIVTNRGRVRRRSRYAAPHLDPAQATDQAFFEIDCAAVGND